MYVVKKINIKRFARLFGLLSATFSLIPAVFGVLAFLFALLFRGGLGLGWFSYVPLVWAIIMPLVTYLLGCIFGSVFGYMYNYLAERDCGLEIDIEMLPEAKQ